MSTQIPNLQEAVALAKKAAANGTKHSAHITFSLAGKQYEAVSFRAVEAISHCGQTTLIILVDRAEFFRPGFLASVMGKPGLVKLTDVAGNIRTLAGSIFAGRNLDINSRGQVRLELTLQPRLFELMQASDKRVFHGLSVPELVKFVLDEHSIPRDRARWSLKHPYPTRPYTLQYGESDLAFIERLLASVGIAYFFTEHEGADVIQFSDDNSSFQLLDLGPIPFVSDAGLDKPIACFNGFKHGLRDVAVHAQIRDYDYTKPEDLIKAGIVEANDAAIVYYGTGTGSQLEAEVRHRSIEERYALEALDIQITGSVAGLTLAPYSASCTPKSNTVWIIWS